MKVHLQFGIFTPGEGGTETGGTETGGLIGGGGPGGRNPMKAKKYDYYCTDSCCNLSLKDLLCSSSYTRKLPGSI